MADLRRTANELVKGEDKKSKVSLPTPSFKVTSSKIARNQTKTADSEEKLLVKQNSKH